MTRVPDVMDVWFDSGGASLACLGYPKKSSKTKFWWPADFIVEGRDQVTLWFFALLKSGMVTMGKVPYKTVLMHGFALDSEGREMHKSAWELRNGSMRLQRNSAETHSDTTYSRPRYGKTCRFSWDAVKQYSGDLEHNLEHLSSSRAHT